MTSAAPCGVRRDDAVVFLGPSLPLAAARARLNAIYLPPASCGDVLRSRRLKPRVIGLIDGYFEGAPAVWHKELLAVLGEGVAVYGASSMGALRAAELDRFGMIGVGEIYRAYAEKRIEADDEVALLHAPAAAGFIPLTEPLVNIRATLDAAVVSGLIDETLALGLVEDARSTSFHQRRLADLIKRRLACPRRDDDRERLAELGRRVEAGFQVDQKALDAEALLSAIADHAPRAFGSSDALVVSRSVFLRHLTDATNARALPFDIDLLPAAEREVSCARALGHTYLMLVRLARLLSLGDAIERHLGPEAIACADAGEARRVERHLRIWDAAAFARRTGPRLEAVRSCIWTQSSLRWLAIEAAIERRGFDADREEVQGFSDTFRRERRIHTTAAFEAWMQGQGMDLDDYAAFVRRCARLIAIVEGEAAGLLGLPLEVRDQPWIIEAARLCGLTPFLAQCAGLAPPPPDPNHWSPDLGDHLRRLGEAVPSDLARYARDLDFEGLDAFGAMVQRLSPVLEDLCGEDGG